MSPAWAFRHGNSAGGRCYLLILFSSDVLEGYPYVFLGPTPFFWGFECQLALGPVCCRMACPDRVVSFGGLKSGDGSFRTAPFAFLHPLVRRWVCFLDRRSASFCPSDFPIPGPEGGVFGGFKSISLTLCCRGTIRRKMHLPRGCLWPGVWAGLLYPFAFRPGLEGLSDGGVSGFDGYATSRDWFC